MRKKNFLGITYLILMLLPCPQLHQPAAAENTGPQIQITEKVYEFGTVIEGQNITHTFELKNAGQSELKILDVNTG